MQRTIYEYSIYSYIQPIYIYIYIVLPDIIGIYYFYTQFNSFLYLINTFVNCSY